MFFSVLLHVLVYFLAATSVRCELKSSKQYDIDLVNFHLSNKYGFGSRASIAIASDDGVIEVDEFLDQLYFRVGRIDGLSIKWLEGKQWFATGSMPQIASDGKGRLIVVFQASMLASNETRSISTDGWRLMHYVTGTFDATTISSVSWNDACLLANHGHAPTVALNANGQVLLAYQTHVLGNLSISFQTGHLNNNTNVLVLDEAHVLNSGVSPRIALNNNNEVVVVYREATTLQACPDLYARAGLLGNNNGIEWSAAKVYDNGRFPGVALNDNGIVIEVHEGSTAAEQLFSRIGKFVRTNQSCSISWTAKSREPFDNGRSPSVAVNSHVAVLVHHSRSIMPILWFTASLVVDRRRWMSDNFERLRNKHLWELTLPATHDSGAYNLSVHRAKRCGDAPEEIPGELTRMYAETQKHSVLQQLRGGVRFFDIRVYFWKRETVSCVRNSTTIIGTDDFHIYHDNIGERLSRILEEIVEFFQESKRELIILTFSHFCRSNFDPIIGPLLHRRLINLINSTIGQYLYKADWTVNLLNITLEKFLVNGSKALVIYEDPQSVIAGSGSGIWPKLNRFDRYSNTDKLFEMESDQLQKLKSFPGFDQQLFLLSWTLTWQGDIFQSLHELTTLANRQLTEFVQKFACFDKINFLYVDYYNEAGAVDLAILLNSEGYCTSETDRTLRR